MRAKHSKSAKYEEITEAGWDVLAAEIVMQAYADFVNADRKMKQTIAEQDTLSPRSFTERMSFAMRTKYEVRKFFNSKWYADICKIDRERFLKKLDEVEAAI